MIPYIHLTLRAQQAPFHSIVVSTQGEIVGSGPKIGSTVKMTINDEATEWVIEDVVASLAELLTRSTR
ncbi:hypothetical protein [Hymenobacter psychrophilus]|uniref:Uncharacterized protein n=1 Tax=Hymenobacter psychrophilus TaxID=651662 RepID=A0A1H3PCA4_9BACT|nr:hypothetical protein [Hymenobacter psychrophilus]SDY98019.1 hypothetical protein SAMN04488069_1268 [Hymenobacter psychrophilus]